MKLNTKTQKGFTLIEVLVAITIFMIFITSISSAYLDIARSQREANAVRAIYSEMRYVFELIGDEARSKTIDYGCPSSFKDVEDGETGFARTRKETSLRCPDLNGVSKSDYLALVSDDRTQRTIFWIKDAVGLESKSLYFYKEKKEVEETDWKPAEGFERGFVEIELNNISIDNFAFEISPLVDPFDIDNIACGAVQFQPAVSMYVSISSKSDQVTNFNLDLQTTISSRVYNNQTDL